ncbi:MAG: NifU family protein [Flavobacteriales bacterium]|jgi:Fe-S cluster biogenesis protein NfuA|nr:NifU family protein [Flavobacteriales bacterium]MBT6013637.1 NifU family protein [Flavobacteriales bacterium]MBT7481415.1 NifU family protein [Flavobacteriales bacterium]|tara:strand:- start:55 stop:309 length:255 start_codon:yes stop_codon:yes gene_type:complete
MGIITDKNIIDKIEGALTKIRPYLEADGGDINLVEVTDKMVVKVKMIGTCSNCNVSMMTLKNGVEVAIKRAVPEVIEVIDVTSL